MASLANKVGIVTGGGTGIGRATALAMARAGASLVIGNRGAKLGEDVVRAIEQAGGVAAELAGPRRSLIPSSGCSPTRPATLPGIRSRSMGASARNEMSQVSSQGAPATAAVAAHALPGNGIVEPDAAATAAPIRDDDDDDDVEGVPRPQSRHEVRPARMHFGH